ncbi:ferritin-like domain-containing protein [Salinimicrobium flavum]|uniref:PA2169 family four-helix-bundle protein n=1 Tax=Salinimicrobium flavum TaxID=1737065 RepID=A0ABW5IY54_9FLAO
MKTTRESVHEDSHKKLVNALQELLEKNYDSEKAYKTAMERTENAHLKNFFKTQAAKKNHNATQIDRHIHSLNEKPKESGSALGTIHRTWINLRSSIGGNKDKVLLEECMRGEKNSIREYEEKLKKNRFPNKIEGELHEHLEEMRTTHTSVKSIDDLK